MESQEGKEAGETQGEKTLCRKSTDAEIAQVLTRTPFIGREETLNALRKIDTERLERLAKEIPTLSPAIYDVLLSREELLKERTNEAENTEIGRNRILSTPITPYSRWSSDISRFTRLDLETARKLGAVLRRKYPEVKRQEIIEIVRKLEQICISEGFLTDEKELALALLNVALVENVVSPLSTLQISALLKKKKYPGVEQSLIRYFEEIGAEEGEDALVKHIREKKEGREWCMRVFLSAYSERSGMLFEEIQGEIEELVREGKISQAADLLRPIYIHSTEEFEQKIVKTFEDKGAEVIEKCKENIWM